MGACGCVQSVGVVCAGLREPLRKGCGSKLKNSFLMAQVWRHLVPIMFAFFWGLQTNLGFQLYPV